MLPFFGLAVFCLLLTVALGPVFTFAFLTVFALKMLGVKGCAVLLAIGAWTPILIAALY